MLPEITKASFEKLSVKVFTTVYNMTVFKFFKRFSDKLL